MRIEQSSQKTKLGFQKVGASDTVNISCEESEAKGKDVPWRGGEKKKPGKGGGREYIKKGASNTNNGSILGSFIQQV